MSVDRILLVSLDNLGDMVFASALAPPLHERFPRAKLDVWCKEYTADVAKLVPHVSEVIASDPFWDRAPGRGKGSWRPFLRAVRLVRSRRYDVAVLAAAPWRTAAAVAATRIPVRIGLRRRKNRIFLTEALPDENPRVPVLSELSRLLVPLGAPHESLRYRLDASLLTAHRERLARIIEQPYAALHPFASKENRCVPMPVWREVARRLGERGLTVLWVGSREELGALRATGNEHSWRFMDRDSDGTLADTGQLSLRQRFSSVTIPGRCMLLAPSACLSSASSRRANRFARSPKAWARRECLPAHHRQASPLTTFCARSTRCDWRALYASRPAGCPH